jgi:hypothetical protein
MNKIWELWMITLLCYGCKSVKSLNKHSAQKSGIVYECAYLLGREIAL